MKKIMLFGLLLVALSFTSCELTKDFVVTIERTFDVNYAQTTYDKTEKIDGTEASSDFDKYADDLKSVDIVKATYIVTSFTGSLTQKIVSATVKVGPTDGSTATDLASMSNVVLSAVAAKEQTLTTNQSGEDKFQELLLKDPHQALVYFAGSANEAPLKFQIKFKFECKVKYEKKLL